MRELAALLAVACLIGCEDASGQSEGPDWSVPLQHFAVDGWVGANSAAVRASDRSFIVAVHAPNLRVRIGEQMLEGSQLVRVSAEGAVLGITAVDEADVLGGGRTQLRTDDRGNTIVLWGDALSLASYDADLNRTWVQPFDTTWSTPFDVSAQGAIAIVSTDGLAGTATIHSLHPDGTIAWEATQIQILGIRFAANGDLFVFGAGHRWRYDPTGDIIEDIRVTSGTTRAEPDGAWFYALVMPGSSRLDRYDSTGQLAWSRTVPYSIEMDSMIESATGDRLVRADVLTGSPALLVIDPSTGDHHQLDSGCVMATLVDADAEHCYGIGIHGLSQFALP